MADKKKSWTKTVDQKLKKNLDLAAIAAYENGCELSIDAQFLFKAQRYSRATALAILAEEEFSKAFTLKLSAVNERWDSIRFNALHHHANKQGLAEAVVNFIEWEKAKVRQTGGQMSEYPDENKGKQFVAEAKKRSRKPEKDYLKQKAFYVCISPEGEIKSVPRDINVVGTLTLDLTSI